MFISYEDKEFINLDGFTQKLAENIAAHKRWYIIEGLVFIIAAALAAMLPFATALGINMLVGALFFLSGGVQVLLFMKRRERWLRLFSGLLSLVCGGIMLLSPHAGLMALSLLLGVFLLLEGPAEIAMAFMFRPFPTWWLMLFSGILSIVMGILVFIFFPMAGLLYIGLTVAINLFFYGIAILALAMTCRKKTT